jgi:hypothetical protein
MIPLLIPLYKGSYPYAANSTLNWRLCDDVRVSIAGRGLANLTRASKASQLAKRAKNWFELCLVGRANFPQVRSNDFADTVCEIRRADQLRSHIFLQ